MRLTTALPVPRDLSIDSHGLRTIDLPPVDRAATTVVSGPPDRFAAGFQALHDWVEQTGEQATDSDREVYVDCDGPPDTWVTELQTILEPRH